MTLDGTPLASGPNATGTTTGDYGNNTLTNSVTNDNGRYGVDIIGGTNITVTNNTSNRNLMGIVVSKPATNVTVTGNTVDHSAKHGIALLDGVTESTISENSVSGADIALYLRNSSAIVQRNRISNATTHGIVVLGTAPKTSLVANTISGRGASPIDTSRATGSTTHKNFATGWKTTKSFWVTVRGIFQPLTILWTILGLIVLIAAIAGPARRSRGKIRDPYASHVPLTSLSRGIVATTVQTR